MTLPGRDPSQAQDDIARPRSLAALRMTLPGRDPSLRSGFQDFRMKRFVVTSFAGSGRHCPAVRRAANCQIVACTSRTLDHAESLARAYGATAYRDVPRMLE